MEYCDFIWEMVQEPKIKFVGLIIKVAITAESESIYYAPSTGILGTQINFQFQM